MRPTKFAIAMMMLIVLAAASRMAAVSAGGVEGGEGAMPTEMLAQADGR